MIQDPNIGIKNNESSIITTQEYSPTKKRSKSGIEQQTPEFLKSAARMQDPNTARSKWRRNKTQEKLNQFKAKGLPEFKLVSEFNFRKGLKKAQEFKTSDHHI